MRKTLRVEVEVTIETDQPDWFTEDALAGDVRDIVQERLMTDYGNVVVMTVTPAAHPEVPC